MTSTMTRRTVHVAVIVATLIVSARVHAVAGLTFPLPWSDEGNFLWQAHAFAQTNTLSTPELNPDRDVYRLPPAYMVVIGTLFKVTGMSLAAARWFSWTCIALAFVGLAVFFNRYPLPLLSTVLLSLFFLNSHFVASGNVARMDSLLFLTAVATFCLLQSGHRWPAVALVSTGLLIHPNGGYFALGAATWLVYERGLQWGTPSRLGWTALGVALLAWVAYAAYVLPNWTFLIGDLSSQFGVPMNRDPMEALLSGDALLPLLWLTALVALAFHIRRDLLLPLVFGGSSFLVQRFRREMWYEPFNDLAWLIVGLASVWLVAIALAPRARLAAGGIALGCLALVGFYYRNGFIEGPRGYPRDMTWSGLVMAFDEVPYLTSDDVERVKRAVEQHLPRTGTVRVSFHPWGDSLFFRDAWGESARPFRPLLTEAKPDILVARKSRYIPNWEADRQRRAFAPVPEDLAPFHERDQTERWYIVSLRPSDPNVK